MIGTLINAGLILAGCLLGLLLHRSIPERLKTAVTQGLALCTILIGARSALGIDGTALGEVDILCVIVCMVAGGLLGSLIDIERRLDQLGHFLEKRMDRDGQGRVSKAFFTASLLYCVGAMAIVGSIESTLSGNHSILIAKGMIDGITAIFFTSTLGPGVSLSAGAVLIYQGLISLLARWLQPLLTEAMLTQMSAVGGLLVMGIGMNMMRREHLAVGNLLPAIFLPMLYLPVAALF